MPGLPWHSLSLLEGVSFSVKDGSVEVLAGPRGRQEEKAGGKMDQE